MFIAVSRLVAREETRASEPDTADESSLFDNFLEFVQSKASILLLCILATVALKFGLMFWEFGTVKLPPEVRSPLQLTLPVLQSFITVAVAFAMFLYTRDRRYLRFIVQVGKYMVFILIGVLGFMLLERLAFVL